MYRRRWWKIPKHCIVGEDYKESCKDGNCPLMQICRRSMDEKDDRDKDKKEE